MGKAWKFEISQFLVISGVLRFFTRFGRPFHYIIWKRQSWLKIWKRQSQKIGWYAWAKLSQQLKTGLQHISCRNKKTKHTYRGNLREYRGNVREYRGNLRTNVSTISNQHFQHVWPWPKNFNIPPLYLLFPQNQFSESMAPRLKRERGCGCCNLAKSFIAFFWFYRNVCFPSRFFKPRWSIAFISCSRVSQVTLI